MIRVRVVGGSTVTRAGLEAVLGGWPMLEVARGEDSPSDRETGLGAGGVLGHAGEAPVDVLVIDTGADAWVPRRRETDGRGPWRTSAEPPAIVLLAGGTPPEWSSDLVAAGVRAVLPPDATAEEILAAVLAAASDLVALPSSLAAAVLPEGADPDAGRPLTPRETEVLELLARGHGNKGVARRLGISEHTVKTHVAALMDKLGATTRTEAVAIGARRGLIML